MRKKIQKGWKLREFWGFFLKQLKGPKKVQSFFPFGESILKSMENTVLVQKRLSSVKLNFLCVRRGQNERFLCRV